MLFLAVAQDDDQADQPADQGAYYEVVAKHDEQMIGWLSLIHI